MTHLERARSFVPSAHVLGEFEHEQLFKETRATAGEPPETDPRVEAERALGGLLPTTTDSE